MVVLTAFLVKAAYDRYNSNNTDSDNNTNHGGARRGRRGGGGPRRFHRKRRQPRQNEPFNNDSANILHNSGDDGDIPAINFTREHSFQILNSMNRSSPTQPNNRKCSRYIHHGNSYTLDTRRQIIFLRQQQCPTISPLNNDTSNDDATILEVEREEEEGEVFVSNSINETIHHSLGTDNAAAAAGVAPDRNDEKMTFRNDIRNDWVDAIFGKDFYPIQQPQPRNELKQSSSRSSDNHEKDKGIIGIHQGVGEANIPHYVAYGAIVDPSTTKMTSSSSSSSNRTTTMRAAETVTNNSSMHSTTTATSSSSFDSLSTPARKVVQSKTQSTPILLHDGEDEDDPSIVTCHTYNMRNNGHLRDENVVYPQQQQQQSIQRPTLSSSSSTSNLSHHSILSATSLNNNNNNKLGITIVRIPLGLYVKSIHIHSEAYAAGISPGSILVSVNESLGLLGERSDRALERLWLYAGLLGLSSSGGGGADNGVLTRRSGDLIEGDGGGVNEVGNHRTAIAASSTSSSSTRPPPQAAPPAAAATTTRSGSTTIDVDDNLQVKRPIQLTLYKSGHLYTVILLSGNPLWGIEWAPCGNFALVQRVVVGLAGANAGVRRGTIVCGVNGESLRTLDHVGVARMLRSKFVSGERMIIGLGYTPAASRSTFLEREDSNNKKGGGGESGTTSSSNGLGNGIQVSRSRSPILPTSEGGPSQQKQLQHLRSSQNKKTMKRTKDCEHYTSFRDVEVRSRPMEYSTAISETFFACAGPSAMGMVMEDSRNDASVGAGRFSYGDVANNNKSNSNSSNIASGIADVAAYVAAGGILPPGGVTAAAANIAAIRSRVAMSSNQSRISVSRRFQPPPPNFGPCPTLGPGLLLKNWNPLASLVQSMLYHAAGCCETKFVEMGGPFEKSGLEAESAAYSVTECIRVIQEIATASPTAELILDGHLLQLLGVAVSPTMANQEVLRSSETMFDVLIDVAITNISLCQRLFFLLRSFIGVLETLKTDHCETTVIALKLLRYAQRRLSGRMFDKSIHLKDGRHGSVGYPMNYGSSSSNSLKQQYVQQQYAHLTIPASESATSPVSLESPDGVDSLPFHFGGEASLGSTLNENLHRNSNQLPKKKGKGKKILKLFKKRSQKIPPTSDLNPKSPERVQAKTFTFSNVFHKNNTTQTDEMMSMSRIFENMAWILRQIDNTCSVIENNLMKSFSQKVADWALWSSSKESALASVTQSFRSDLRHMNNPSQSSSAAEMRFPILNPLDPAQLLTSVDPNECFILPSAHFPLLLCFDSTPNTLLPITLKNERSHNEGSRQDVLYRTKVEILGMNNTRVGAAFTVHGSVAGVIQESTAAIKTLVFETKSDWGHPKTLSLKISSLHPELTMLADEKNQNDVGCGFVDLCPIWRRVEEGYEGAHINAKCRIYTFDSAEEFDQHGEVDYQSRVTVELKLRVSAEIAVADERRSQKCLLLYKHGDDLRQELLAIQFIERCNEILKASGLDLKLKTFRCLPVGAQKGFIEWVKGTVPLSELCSTSGSSNVVSNPNSFDGKQGLQSVNNLADTPQPQRRNWCKYKSLRGLRLQSNGTLIENPIQDFLRSAAFDESAPYFVKKDVMDTYVKSCAGYCVITYLLGVGDRHLDNILLHQNGHFLHCDYSFILGHDPKTYMPMRITEEMVRGFGGRECDNFARFISFTGAAFLTLRRHNNLRSLLSHIRLMVDSNLVDVSVHQPPEEAVLAMRGRFRLDLDDDDALTYIEDIVEKSITSKMWKAVDVIHSIGMHF